MRYRFGRASLGIAAAAAVAAAASAAGAASALAAEATQAAAPTPSDAAAPAATTPAPIIRLITLDGVRALKARTVVAAAAKAVLGKPGDHAALVTVTKAVDALYHEKGYPVAQVVSANVTPDGTLELGIVEGRVRRIVVRGNKRTRTATILEALGTQVGDAYNTNAVKDDRNRLARLGIFNDVTITAQIPGAIDEPPSTMTENPPASTSGSGTTETVSSTKTDKNGKTTTTTATTGSPDQQPATPVKGDKGAPDSGTAPAAGNETAAGGPPPAAGQAGAKAGAPAGDIGAASGPDAKGGVIVQHVPALPPLPPSAEPLPPDEDRVGDVDLVVRVVERQTANIAATVGYADVIGPVGFVDLSEMNLAGTGQRVAAEWQRTSSSYLDQSGNLQRGDSRQAVNFSYERPALGLRSTAYSLDLYNQNTVFMPTFTDVDYTIRTFEKRDGGTVRVGHALGRKWTGYLTARHDDVGYDINGLESTYLDTGDQSLGRVPISLLKNAQGTVGALGFVLIGDGRDAADNPRKGYLNSITFEDSSSVFGGNRDFRQALLDTRQYVPLGDPKKGPVFATRLMVGYSQGSTPLPEFYFIGGYELLRGYEIFSIYGDRMLLGSGELRTTLSPGLQGVAFVDAGNAWLPGDTFGDGGVKVGAGVGLRFLSPIGPLRLDLAYGDQFRTYVSLGQSF